MTKVILFLFVDMAISTKAEAYRSFVESISKSIAGDRIQTDDLRLLAWGTDAGFYRMTPKVVIHAKDESEVSLILNEAKGHGLPVTFRAAGTSLSGQAISDSILVVAGKNWEDYTVHEDGSISLQPGIVGARVNRILAPFGRSFGPDPASIGSCMVGGIVMNNASGMSCGTHANSDRMMRSARLILMDGTVLDTSDEDSRKAFAASHKELLDEIISIRNDIFADSELLERIRYKYSIKNVTGLNLLPFVRFEDPFDIIAHLLTGSEGTLAFMSQVTMDTLPVAPYKASAMIYFENISDAAKAVVAIRHLDINAAELLDRRSLASVGDRTGQIEGEADRDITAVLTQTVAETPENLEHQIREIIEALSPFKTVTPVHFSTDAAECARFWAIRSGIFPTVGGMRRQGTTCLIEDIAFHIEDLPQATVELSELLDRHGYDDSCIYGHALEGNFHFIINQAFDSDADVARYEAMIRDVAEMVVSRYDGSLKAEHGTGRNMAPFVEFEWGSKAFNMMKRVKKAFDPDNLLNPGVIFNDDPRCFLRDFKALPVLNPGKGASKEMEEAYKKINKCIECGFCEVNCVSCGFTLSSRTRIVAQREITRLEELAEKTGDISYSTKAQTLRNGFRYLGDQTCAGDGLCSMSCPMGISVADLTHEIRRINSPIGSLAHGVGQFAADHFPAAKSAVRGLLASAQLGESVLGGNLMNDLCKGLHNGFGIPLWTSSTPGPYKLKKQTEETRPLKVVYFPSCINQTMGLPKGSPVRKPLADETAELLHKAGYEVIYPEGHEKLCCGTIWESKGMPDIADRKTSELEEALWEASNHGEYPVLCDQSPCLHRMRTKIRKMHLYEPAEFIWKYLRERLEFNQTSEPVAIHTTCSTRLMGLAGTLYDLAALCSSDVLVPEGVGCCGYAGDKGMTRPELNKWALRKLKPQLEAKGIKVGYSNSRTCEIGLATNSGIPYVSIVYLVNAHTEAK
ncbi:MAG: FAD-binding oxidoreductase [Bacteroidales bacterium]|nr:FAD-binding oxidoreductase [Bacteroidales bacterium]